MWFNRPKESKELAQVSLKLAETQIEIKDLRHELDALRVKFMSFRGTYYRARGWEQEETEEKPRNHAQPRPKYEEMFI